MNEKGFKMFLQVMQFGPAYQASTLRISSYASAVLLSDVDYIEASQVLDSKALNRLPPRLQNIRDQ